MINELPVLPILLFSAIVHEIAHGWVALRLGDPTARDLGRLTLNPIPHIDPVGSVLVPLVSLVAAGHVFIAWAKPVPVNPGNFLNPRRDNVLVSAAGPASNLVLALVCSVAVILFAALTRAAGGGGPEMVNDLLHFMVTMFYGGVYMNVVLAVFNTLPIPPLDGSHLLAAALPADAAQQYMRIGFLGVILFLFLLRVPAVAQTFMALIGAVFSPFRALVEFFV
ncbi:MAG: site-2 protease family protein [Bacteroidota bacterium]